MLINSLCSALPCRDWARRSERFNEENLRGARLANRNLDSSGSDARLEALFGDPVGREDREKELQAMSNIQSWESGAEEAAKLVGAEVKPRCDLSAGCILEKTRF